MVKRILQRFERQHNLVKGQKRPDGGATLIRGVYGIRLRRPNDGEVDDD